MISDSSGYDLLTSMVSPGGKIYQISYASKAVSRSDTAIGMRGSDGIVLAVGNVIKSPLYENSGNGRTFTIDEHIGAVVAGFMPDARAIVNEARSEASLYRNNYGSQVPLSYLKMTVGAYVHAYTMYGCFRPFGASLIMGAYMPDGPQLYCIQPSGEAQGFFGCAIGKDADEAKSEMEDIDFKSTSIVELVKEAARVIYAVVDDESDFDLELSWSGKITNGKHVSVPSRVSKEAKDYAERMMEEKS